MGPLIFRPAKWLKQDNMLMVGDFDSGNASSGLKELEDFDKTVSGG